ncbi:MAG TPA: SPOR domain-containing protein [Moheibacter sp.]|nr:SPOR domain-containing protein [Moheibacter sp.]
MILENYISALLYTQDCVIVPEFGGFIAQKTNATYQPENATFFPPKKELAFNPSLMKNDGLLIQYIASAEGISFEKAKNEVESSVLFWKNHLKQNQVLNLSGLGELKQNSTGQIEFNAIDKNYLLDSFGLEKIQATRILPVEKQQNSNLVWWKVASVVPVLLGGYLYFGKPQPVTDFVNKQWSGFTFSTWNSNTEAEVVSKSVLSKVEEISENTYQFKDFTVYDYQVIAGAFRVKSEAETMERKLLERGFEFAKLTQKKGSYYYVAFQTFPTKEKALELRKTLQEEYPETWVLSLKD